MSDNEHLFRYTTGRFLADDKRNMSERYVRFDVEALKRIGATAIGADSCTKVEKHHEGVYNKIILLTMNNGSEVIAKIPHPMAGIAHQTIASEVATMEFVREHLNTPVPKVYAWSSNASESEIGAEYIIMEKCPGVRLETVWARFDVSLRSKVLVKLAELHASWASTSFNSYGSLYFASDLENSHSAAYTGREGEVDNPKFAIGPTIDRKNFDNYKKEVEFGRGPWDSAESYLTGVGEREIACVNNAPRFPIAHKSLFGPGTYIPTKEKKLRAINAYLELVKCLTPDKPMSLSCLWHPDDIAILVNPETADITAILDWQSTELAPLFCSASAPNMEQFEGASVPGAESPHVPGFVEQHGEAGFQAGSSFFQSMIRTMIGSTYKVGVKHICPDLDTVLEWRTTPAAGILILGSSLFIDAEPTYMAGVKNLRRTWHTMTTKGNYPFNFSTQESLEIEFDNNRWRRAGQALQIIGRSLDGIEVSGGFMVSPWQYEEAKQIVRTLRQQWISQMARNEEQKQQAEQWWPFDD